MLRDAPGEVLNVEQAAALLGFSSYTVREKARLGEIPGRKTGREWRFLRTALLEYLGGQENHTVKERHTLRHSALATAVRVLIELEVLRPSSDDFDYEIQRQRMQLEVDKWDGTNDVYALGIMAPLKALT